MNWYTCVNERLFTEILRDSVDSTEIELRKDGRWHVTKTDDSEDECNSPKPAKSGGRSAPTTISTSGMSSVPMHFS